MLKKIKLIKVLFLQLKDTFSAKKHSPASCVSQDVSKTFQRSFFVTQKTNTLTE